MPLKVLRTRNSGEVFNYCLSTLPPRLFDVYSLYEIGGLNSQEICEILDIFPSSFWEMFNRARIHLRRYLKTGWFGNEKTANEVAMDAGF